MAPEDPKVFIAEEAIRQRVADLGRRISMDYAGVDNLLLVGVLRGCFIFLADLSRVLTIPRAVDFISVSHYDTNDASTGCVRLNTDLRTDIAGKHVLIVDGIVDSGYTLGYLISLLAPRHPASLKCCALLCKPACLKTDVKIDYLGFEIPDAWVVGYGLDYRGRCRTLPYIGIFTPSERG